MFPKVPIHLIQLCYIYYNLVNKLPVYIKHTPTKNIPEDNIMTYIFYLYQITLQKYKHYHPNIIMC